MDVRHNEVEVIQVTLAHPSGPLIVLPPGQTLVTLGLRR